MLTVTYKQATEASRFGRPAPLQIDLTRRIGVSTETTTPSPQSRAAASKEALVESDIDVAVKPSQKLNESSKSIDMVIPITSTIHHSPSGKLLMMYQLIMVV